MDIKLKALHSKDIFFPIPLRNIGSDYQTCRNKMVTLKWKTTWLEALNRTARKTRIF